MSGSHVECTRWRDGVCPGGPCDTCRHDAVNEYHDMRITIIAQRIIILALAVTVMMAAVLP